MAIRLIQVPYDSGHRDMRMGRGPSHLMKAGLLGRLSRIAPTSAQRLETTSSFITEIGSAFELHRALSAAVSRTVRAGDLPLVLSGNCNSALGTVAGLLDAMPEQRIAVVWFDGHGDCNTPETFTGDFLDAMGLSTLTGRCWQALSATVPGFQPLPDERVLLIGAHGADAGARDVLAASNIGHVATARARESIAALEPAMERLAQQGVTRIYLHLDMDVLDAAYARANEFAPSGGFFPAELSDSLDAVLGRFPVAAAAVASYDPSFDHEDRIREQAILFLERLAAQAAPRPMS